MSSGAVPAFSNEVLAYVRVWTESFAEVLAQVGGAPVPCESGSVPPEEPSDADLWIRGIYRGARAAELVFRLPESTVNALANVFLGSPAESVSASGAEEQREAVLELIRQVGGLVATRAPDPRGESQLRLEASAAPSWKAAATMGLRVALAVTANFEIRLTAELLEALLPAPGQPPPPSVSALPAAEKLGTLMNVELTVSLRFGGRSMLLKDILDLCPGAVVELDRQVQDPVELLLDGKKVARGEVVVVDGNYGLRVTELLSNGGTQ
jgi:flagellar motor switch protein FliN/FliY